MRVIRHSFVATARASSPMLRSPGLLAAAVPASAAVVGVRSFSAANVRENTAEYASVKGVRKEVIKEGTGSLPKKGQTAVVHYTGTLLNGTVFDSSRKRDVPFEFRVGAGEVIRGWDEGVATMKKGEVARLIIAADYAYGSRGAGKSIPPNSVLVFEVEVLDYK